MDKSRLEWDHPFLLQLPPDFDLVQEFAVTYKVYGSGNGVPSLSVAATNHYLDLTSVKHCVEYEFVVQAVANVSHISPSQNSSAVRGNFSVGGECVHLLLQYNIIVCMSGGTVYLQLPLSYTFQQLHNLYNNNSRA